LDIAGLADRNFAGGHHVVEGLQDDRIVVLGHQQRLDHGQQGGLARGFALRLLEAGDDVFHAACPLRGWGGLLGGRLRLRGGCWLRGRLLGRGLHSRLRRRFLRSCFLGGGLRRLLGSRLG